MRHSTLLNVFTYHRILPWPSKNGVSVQTFLQQLDYLQEHYRILDARQLECFLSEGWQVSNKPLAVLTFDDGWLDNWLIATPILKARKISALLALSTGLVHSGALRTQADCADIRLASDEAFSRALYQGDPCAFLSWEEIKAMQETGLWSIEAHGHSHRASYYSLKQLKEEDCFPKKNHWALQSALGEDPFQGVPVGELVSELACRRKKLRCSNLLQYAESFDQFKERVKSDMAECVSLIYRHTMRFPIFFFWPWGHYSTASLQIAKESGFRYTFSTEKGYVRIPGPTEPLPRIGVSEKLNKFKKDSIIFRSKTLSKLRSFVQPTKKGLREA
ncbi:MAG: polysaccharide deacetylase family protein [Gammaproteobacteria bacterium]|nr:polysaccharide deacetylase family protein [Gammaproteobacteria bacterium]